MESNPVLDSNILNQTPTTHESSDEIVESEAERKKYEEYRGLVSEFFRCSGIITVSRGKLEQMQRLLNPQGRVRYSFEKTSENMATGKEEIQVMAAAWEKLTTVRAQLEEFIAEDARIKETTKPNQDNPLEKQV